MSADEHADVRAARPGGATEGPTRFSAYAVPSRSGPHVTVQAGVVHAGRFWTTTAGHSLKARSVAAHRRASATVVDDEGRVQVLAGRTNRMRPFRPLDLLRDPVSPLRSPSAVLRLGVGQAEQLIGYFEAAHSLPADWLPHRRVLLVTRIDRSLTLVEDDVVDVDGAWERRVGDALRPSPGPGTDLPLDRLPDDHAEVVSADRVAHVGLSAPAAPVALPARWRGGGDFELASSALRAVAADLPGRAAATFDESESRRPDEKLGVMFRGGATLVDVSGERATIRLHSERITTWDGFDAHTFDLAPVEAA